MTPVEVATAARDLYNATGDTFFGDTQLYNWMWQGCHELAMKAWCIEAIDSSQSTVAGTQGYAYGTNVIAIKRVTVNGKKLKRITMREDDAITLSNQAVSTQGYPIYYYEFNNTIYMRPIPDAIYTIGFWTYNDAAVITAVSTFTIPTLFQFDLVDYCLFRMFAKDKDVDLASLHKSLWEQHVKEAISFQKRQRRTDSFATVQSEDTLPVTILGES